MACALVGVLSRFSLKSDDNTMPSWQEIAIKELFIGLCIAGMFYQFGRFPVFVGKYFNGPCLSLCFKLFSIPAGQNWAGWVALLATPINM